MKKLAIIFMLYLFLSGCAELDYVHDAPRRVKAADWSKMKSVTVVLSEYSFSPDRIGFKANVPYKLQLINKGSEKHYFTADKFFRSIAMQKVQSNSDGEIKAPYLTSIEVYPGRSLDVYFIPVKKGFYSLKCTMRGHAVKGVVGKIAIK